MFMSAPFLTSLRKLIPVCDASNLENKASLFSEFSLEQLIKKKREMKNKIIRLNIFKILFD